MTKTIGAIFAHPDDEVLGAGATLARHAEAGADVRILILATGLSSRGETGQTELNKLRDQGRRAADILGASRIEFGDFPDNRMDTVGLLDIVQRVESFLSDVPTVIYTHHGGDLNIDHRITNQAVVTALRPLPGVAPHEILACEVNSSTEWAAQSEVQYNPNVFVDVSKTLKIKLAALSCYVGELREWPHPRSLEGVRNLASRRGMQCGVDAAESFQLIRKVDH